MADEATTPEADAREGQNAPEQPEVPQSEDKGAGSKAAVLADLATERDKRQALESKFNDLRDGLAAALGLGQTEQVTPEQLTEQVNEAQRDAAQARAELAVFRAVPDGIDAQALLDSKAFTQSLTEIDPANPDALAAAITGFVEANPRFRTGPSNPGARDAAAGGPTPTPAGSMDDLLRGRR